MYEVKRYIFICLACRNYLDINKIKILSFKIRRFMENKFEYKDYTNLGEDITESLEAQYSYEIFR